jgi:DNA-binding CsgD family transcriptional regulator
MAAQLESAARGSGCAADRAALGAALVASLELALLAAHRLLGALHPAAGPPAGAAAHLERALALAGAGHAPPERVLALVALAGLSAATGEPTAAGALPTTPCPTLASPDTAPLADRAERAEAHGAAGVGIPPACPQGLTRREREVLRLIAAGHSNREIAAALYLSPRTAERHVANIYLKIGVHSKAEATAYALRHDLV